MAAGGATARQRSFTARIHSTAPPRGAFLCMARFDEPIEPMTLGSMRANGVRSLALSCLTYHHETVINADKLPDQDSRKNLQELWRQIHGRRSTQNSKRPPLHRTQSGVRQIHHLVPPHRQVSLIWKWYQIAPTLTNIHKSCGAGMRGYMPSGASRQRQRVLVGPLARWPRGGALRCRTCARPLDVM
jgi:hypothetical protein